MELFRTPIFIVPSEIKIRYESHIMMIGSCFSENMGNHLSEAKFSVDNNPFGIVYNPLSINYGLTRLMDGKEYSADELQMNHDVWFSFDHHGKFSDIDMNTCLSGINNRFKDSAQRLQKANFIFFTFGTSYVYSLKSTGQIVSNCHKIPAKEFDRKRVPLEEIVEGYLTLIRRIRKINPDVCIVFTVSPVRHWKDGAHENQLSKSLLLLATEQICDQLDKTYYFPAYELMMDDLRDYRFYDEDMFHPNSLAVSYIWNKFTGSFMEPETALLMKEVDKIVSARNHRPLNAKSSQYKTFASKMIGEIKRLQDQLQISLHEEEEYFLSILQ